MGKYNYTEKEKKPVKKALFFIFTPLLCIITQAIMVVVIMAVLRSMAVEDNLLKPLSIAMIGLCLVVVYGLFELIYRRKRDISSIGFIIGGYIIPLCVWGLGAIVSVANWWNDRNNEDTIFFKWFTLSILIYVAVAFAYRLVVLMISKIIDRKAEKE